MGSIFYTSESLTALLMQSSCILSIMLVGFLSKSSMCLNVTLVPVSRVSITHSPKDSLSISNFIDFKPKTFDILYSTTVESFVNLTTGAVTLKFVNAVSRVDVIREMNAFSAFMLYMLILISLPLGPAYIIYSRRLTAVTPMINIKCV